MIPVLPSNYNGVLRIKETVFTTTPNELKLIVQQNSSRIWLAFAAGVNTFAFFTQQLAFGVHGFILPSPGLTIFRWDQDGLMPTQQWYVKNLTGANQAGTIWEQFYTET